jgi:hypothetical protein
MTCVTEVKSLTASVEVVEAYWRETRVELAKVEAHAAHAESHVVIVEEELME